MKTTESSQNRATRAAGYSAGKSHWQNVKIHGTTTSCGARLSGGGENDEQFLKFIQRYPETVCQKCLAKFEEHVARQLAHKAKSN